MDLAGGDPNSLSLAFVEGLYLDYLNQPDSVPEDWRRYFDALREGNGARVAHSPSFPPPSLFNPPGGNGANAAAKARVSAAEAATDDLQFLHRVEQLIRNFRVRGHRIAQVDPLGMPQAMIPELVPIYHGFDDEDLDRRIHTRLVPGLVSPRLRHLVEVLETTYCGSVGVQYMHIDSLAVREWLQERMEGKIGYVKLSREEQLRILTRLTDAVLFEEFIQKKYTGAKSFSLEGAETLIPLLATAVEKAGYLGIEEIIMGMAHRGRLNVLANIMGKSPREIFREFDDQQPELYEGRGDVKYHLGYHTYWRTVRNKDVHIALCFNPSHLEYVNPVVLGRVRAQQDRMGDLDRERSMAILIHGDAAFAGEGIVQETLNLSGLGAYTTGGTLHIVVNNQIGFTTNPEESRSSIYATDVAKMLQSPIFHVNGEDPEAVAQVVNLALEFRMTFKRDVVIDMYCYRKRGHNEGDEPAFTQPILYNAIKKRKSVRDGYLDHLLTLGGVTQEDADALAVKRREHLEDELSAARSENENGDRTRPRPVASPLAALWRNYKGGLDVEVEDVATGVEQERLIFLLDRLTTLPEYFHQHPKLNRLLDHRRSMITEEAPIDWGAAEALALASLATEGTRIRMSGQDCERGTFSHRHAVLRDVKTNNRYSPLRHLTPDQARVSIYNSPLSEAGVLGYEYGYSLAYPDGLTIWEAQFGDFVNCAQVIIDQFISSAEDKWGSLSNIVMLLPHGFEGQGPEHSSARIERFTSLAAEDNMQLVAPTTPAQFFHVLRRQVVRPWRKPLIVITPKSLLRHPKCVSSLEDLEKGRFRRVMRDAKGYIDGVDRILMCSGKIYYDLEAEREELGLTNVAILRAEQLYPLHQSDFEEVLAPYQAETPIRWVQEEPENMGAWRRMRGRFGERWFDKFPVRGVYRPESASPATGSMASHKIEQQKVIDEAFDGL